MIFSPQQYIDAKTILFPYQTNSGLIIEKCLGVCKKCHKSVEPLKGIVIEHHACTEFRCAGACHPCKLITSFQFRYYNDGRLLTNSDKGWKEIIQKSQWSSMVSKICKFLHL